MNEQLSLGRYRINTELGSTGFAEVFRASDTVLNRAVILKNFKPELVANKKTRKALLQQLQQSAELVHPHIAWVWDVGEETDRIFSIERNFEGENLEQTLTSSGRLFWEEAYPLFRQAAQAVSFAHARGVVHGNLQPHMLFISQELGAVLTDFGLIQVLGKDAGPYLMEDDQQALARLLLVMVTGDLNLPFNCEIPVEWPVDVPKSIQSTLNRALGLDPIGPYDDVEAFAQALKELADQPQPGLSPENQARLQVEKQARQEAEEARRKAQEEAKRLEDLEAVRLEINQQLQQALEEQTMLTVDNPVNHEVEQSTSPKSEESVEADGGLQAAKGVEADSTDEPGTEVAAVTDEEDQPGSPSAGEPVSPPVEQEKRPRKRRWFLIVLLIGVLLVIIALGLTWVAAYLGIELPFQLPW